MKTVCFYIFVDTFWSDFEFDDFIWLIYSLYMNLKKENFLANLKAAKETTKEIKAVYKEIK